MFRFWHHSGVVSNCFHISFTLSLYSGRMRKDFHRFTAESSRWNFHSTNVRDVSGQVHAA